MDEVTWWDGPDVDERRVPARVGSVDAVRGLAVVLMVVDHACALAGLHRWLPDVAHALRLTLGRASLPLFMLCAGALLVQRPPRASRLVQVLALGVVLGVVLAVVPIGVQPPEILAIYGSLMLGHRLIRSFPVAVLAVGLVQQYAWPLRWNGYQPGLVLAFVALGVLGGVRCLAWGDELPVWLARVGRRPLAWYSGHLAVLVVVGLLVGRAS